MVSVNMIKETSIISTGLSAPVWVNYISEVFTPVLGFMIGICTLVYVFFRAINSVYQWRDDWRERENKERVFLKRHRKDDR